MGQYVTFMQMAEAMALRGRSDMKKNGRNYMKWGGYWWIRLTEAEAEEYPGSSWGGWVRIHKYKIWDKYGLWYDMADARYYYMDGNPDNIRITNIGVKTVRGEWII